MISYINLDFLLLEQLVNFAVHFVSSLLFVSFTNIFTCTFLHISKQYLCMLGSGIKSAVSLSQESADESERVIFGPP